MRKQYQLSSPKPEGRGKTTVPDGHYAVLYPKGQYRVMAVRTVPFGKPMAGMKIVSIRERDKKYTACAFLLPGDTLAFWKQFRATNSQERINRVIIAFEKIRKNPTGAGMTLAMKENICWRCREPLTVLVSRNCGVCDRCRETRPRPHPVYQQPLLNFS